MAPPWAHRTDNRVGHVGSSSNGTRGGWNREEGSSTGARREGPVDSYIPREHSEPGQIISPAVQPISLPSRPSFSTTTDRRKGSDTYDSRPYDRHNNSTYKSRRDRSRSRSRDRERERDRDRDRGSTGRRTPLGRRSPSPRSSRRRSPSPPRRRRSPSPGSRRSSPGAVIRRRSISPSRIKNDGTLLKDLAGFSGTMHSALIAANDLALAKNHLTRLQSFPQSSTSPILHEAQQSVIDAEKHVKEKLVDMRDAFADLMKRIIGMSQDQPAISGPEIASLRARLDKLEDSATSTALTRQANQLGVETGRPVSVFQPRQPYSNLNPYPTAPPSAPIYYLPPPIEQPPPPPPPGDVAMVESSGAVDEVQARRYRARGLLKEVLERMDKMEEDKRAMMMRCDDLENIVWENAEEDMPVMSWERLELSRMETRDLPPRTKSNFTRFMRRARTNYLWKVAAGIITDGDASGDGAGDENEDEEEVETAEMMRVDDDGSRDEVEDGKVDGWDALEATRDPIGAFRGVTLTAQVQNVEKSKPMLEEATVKHGEIEAIRETLEKVQRELAEYKKYSQERERQVVLACMRVMQTDMRKKLEESVQEQATKIVKGEFEKAITTYKPMFSPSVSTSALPSISNTLANGAVQARQSPTVGIPQLPHSTSQAGHPSRSRTPSGQEQQMLQHAISAATHIQQHQQQPQQQQSYQQAPQPVRRNSNQGSSGNNYHSSPSTTPGGLPTIQQGQSFVAPGGQYNQQVHGQSGQRPVVTPSLPMQRKISPQEQVDAIIGYPTITGQNAILQQPHYGLANVGQAQPQTATAQGSSMSGLGYQVLPQSQQQAADMVRLLKYQQAQQHHQAQLARQGHAQQSTRQQFQQFQQAYANLDAQQLQTNQAQQNRMDSQQGGQQAVQVQAQPPQVSRIMPSPQQFPEGTDSPRPYTASSVPPPQQQSQQPQQYQQEGQMSEQQYRYALAQQQAEAKQREEQQANGQSGQGGQG